jgi:chemosensory pili system protein ChpA (sensor histidine kinase/response regulator)
LRASLPDLVREADSAPLHSAARESLKQKLAGLRDDAELIGDKGLVDQVELALKQLASGEAADLAAAVGAMADTAAPAPEISEETQRLLATDAHGLDRELLDIYLLEAAEVLDSVAANLHELTGNPGDREALTTVRRGFHTLKGSGRMVGPGAVGRLRVRCRKGVQSPRGGRPGGDTFGADDDRRRAKELSPLGRCADPNGPGVGRPA